MTISSSGGDGSRQSAPQADNLTAASATPAGLASMRSLIWRRRAMLSLCAALYGVILYFTALFLGDGGVGGDFWSGFSTLDVLLLICVALSAPWTVLGFLNASIGVALMFGKNDAAAWWAPLATPPQDGAAPEGRTAVIMTLRNEDAARAYARLLAIRESIDATGHGERFDVFVLSDSNRPDVVAAERELFARLEPRLAGAGAARYRLREDNEGFKAGNVFEFLDRWGDDYDYFAPMDADSVMSGPALLGYARLLDAHPKLGVLQSMVVGAPNESGFGRLFQFGLRHVMRGFTSGAAWWQGDCGPFWGHNAMLRVAPFKQYCRLPVMPGAPPLGGHLLSHDQVEAVLMRAGGYEVRVAPIETESWEENPPSLTEFLRREERWCNGNMQYGPLLGMKGLEPVSRFQLLQAMLGYVGSIAWMALTFIATLKVFEANPAAFNLELGMALFAGMFLLSVSPKLVGAIAVSLTPGGVAQFGGSGRFAAGLLLETIFSMLIAPVVAFRLTLFMFGLLAGRRIQWNGQQRDAIGLSWREAAKGLWTPTLYGALLTGMMAYGAPAAIPWAAPVLLGLILSIPLAVFTASPWFARFLRRTGLAAIPEDVTPHPLLESVARHEAALSRAPAKSDVETLDPLAGPVQPRVA